MLTARRRWLAVCGAWVSCGAPVAGCAGLFSNAGSHRARTSSVAAGAPGGASVRVPPVAGVSAGGYAGYVVLGDGHVWAWGDGLEGQLGRGGASGLRTTPVKVPGIANVVAVTGGANTAYALQRGGRVWAWGDDAEDELGDAGGHAGKTPVEVHVPGRIVSIAAGMFSAYALRRDGKVWAWGENSVGQLGKTGAEVASGTPRPVARLSGVAAVAAGAGDGYALRRDGHVWAWGEDSFGQLGTGGCSAARAIRPDGSPCPAAGVPVQVQGLGVVTAIAAGANTGYALRRDGTVWAWGDNSFGALGAGTRRSSTQRPVRVAGLEHVAAIAAGSNTGYAVLRDGSVRAWGRGTDGELGDGHFSDRGVPGRVLGLAGTAQVTGGGAMGYALDRRGRVWAWGSGFYGQLGNGQRLTLSQPTLVLKISRLAASL